VCGLAAAAADPYEILLLLHIPYYIMPLRTSDTPVRFHDSGRVTSRCDAHAKNIVYGVLVWHYGHRMSGYDGGVLMGTVSCVYTIYPLPALLFVNYC